MEGGAACIASANVCLMYTTFRAVDKSTLRLIRFPYRTNKDNGISSNFIDTASSLPCSQQVTPIFYPEIEKPISLKPISYIIPIYI